jgi:hypothetical protein
VAPALPWSAENRSVQEFRSILLFGIGDYCEGNNTAGIGR